jgi:peptidoglycan/xylan/chitin deacetylase (PgdA/CDA1 family)
MIPERQTYSRRDVLKLAGYTGAIILSESLSGPVDFTESKYATQLYVSPDNAPGLEKHLPSTHFIGHGPDNLPNVAITIDDFFGTSSIDYLQQVLVLGRSHGVHFTFFPVGKAQIENYRAMPRRTRSAWRQALSDGHSIGNHTYDHSLLGTMSTKAVDQELIGQFNAMNSVLGFKHHEYLMRPPGGSGGFDNPTLHDQYVHTLNAVKDVGYYMTMWTVDSNAPNGQIVTPNEDQRFLNKIFNDPYEHVRDGSIILVHPTTLSINGVNLLIDGLRKRGYRMLSVPELFTPPKKVVM